jgi:hypothetical protein
VNWIFYILKAIELIVPQQEIFEITRPPPFFHSLMKDRKYLKKKPKDGGGTIQSKKKLHLNSASGVTPCFLIASSVSIVYCPSKILGLLNNIPNYP